MEKQFERTALLLGENALNQLDQSRVAVFGIGGVGGHVVEALARSGIGAIDLIDHDTVAYSNINRQIIATLSSVGKYKVDVMYDRIMDINPNCKVTVYKCFYLPETKDQFHFEEYDYIVDAIDTVTGKVGLIMQANEAHTPIISCMGAGNKLNPAMFEVSDIYKTSVCPLAKVMRHELKKRGIKKCKVVYSKELPIKPSVQPDTQKAATNGSYAKPVPGSSAFVPSVAGLIIASEVVKDLCAKTK